jgi:predicted metal-binding membrane protein
MDADDDPSRPAMTGPAIRATLLESALRHERAPLAVVVILLPLVCWAWIAAMAHDMYGPMRGASAWMMNPVRDVRHYTLLWFMWVVMMAGMMLPSAWPTLLLYAGVSRRRAATPAVARQIYALAAGYLMVWTLFSVLVTALQGVLAHLLLLSPMMELTSPLASAAILMIAGVYQLSPLKHACLHACQSPLGFIMRHWRYGPGGAFRMGLEHGLYCLGCCWALMLLLFAGGVMNLVVIAALTVFVAAEKLAPFGATGARASGALLIAIALWMLLR